ncbi:MAG TPA: hypothetical protein VIZ65_01325 [Cellvibrionaceae bacterium]
MQWSISIISIIAAALFTPLVHAVDTRAQASLRIVFSGETASIVIVNPSTLERTLEHPGNQSVLSFAIFDERFNLVAPVGIGKADAPAQKINLKPQQVFRYSVSPCVHEQRKLFFCYISGTAWYGYPIEKGIRYRVVAVYRAGGPDSMGVASDEILFQF